MASPRKVHLAVRSFDPSDTKTRPACGAPDARAFTGNRAQVTCKRCVQRIELPEETIEDNHGEHSLDDGLYGGCTQCIASERAEDAAYHEAEAADDRRRG